MIVVRFDCRFERESEGFGLLKMYLLSYGFWVSNVYPLFQEELRTIGRIGL